MRDESFQLAGWAKHEFDFALFHTNEHKHYLKTLKPYFYALHWHSYMSRDIALIRIGITKDCVQRIQNHASTFPGWKYRLIIECDHADRIESFWRRYLSPWPYGTSSESVFAVPEDHFTFFEVSASMMSTCEWGNYHDDAEWVDSLRSMPISKRLTEMLTYSFGWPEMFD